MSQIQAYVSLHASIVDDLVDVVGGDTRLGLTCRNVQHLACKSANLTHAILLLFCKDLDPVSSNEHLRYR